MTFKDKITYRDIAKMLATRLPVEDEEFGEKVEEYLTIIKSLPQQEKVALRTAFIVSLKAPKEERDDLFQDFTLTLLQSRTTEPKLAYAIANCDLKNWWARYKTRQHYSLDSVVSDTEGNNTTVGELLVGECEFEQKICSKDNAKSILQNLPEAIKQVVIKRLTGKGLQKGERQMLDRWSTKNLHLITALS